MSDAWDSSGGTGQTWAVHVVSWYDPEQGGRLTSIDVRYLEPPPLADVATLINYLAAVAPSRDIPSEAGG
jgi:hypothetical protein